MSNTPIEEGTAPDLAAEELAGKHGISLEEAKRLMAREGHDRAALDGAAESAKTKTD